MKLIKALSFSFVSYVFVLIPIIVLDTFIRKDFDFERALTISAIYIAGLLIYFTILFLVCREREVKDKGVIGINYFSSVKYWAFVFLYSVGIFFLSSVSNIPFISVLSEMDPRKFSLHILEYAGFGFFLYLALINSKFGYKLALVLTLLVGLILGILDESYQLTIPGRKFNPYDILSDEVGMVVGSIIARVKGRSK